MKKKHDNLVDKCRILLGLELSEFAKKYEIPLPTLKSWRTNLPSYGKVMLEHIMENHELKKKLKSKDEKLSKLLSVLDED